ncbi:MAG: rod shape-determining protein MreC [Paludibacteraceae bacterium]|nr:rod shape-determining protein MreC [Paludibacteraceae bacterium]
MLILIRKYSNFLLLVLLEVVAFLWIVNSHPYQRHAVFTSSNRMIGSINEQISEWGGYFSLNSSNQQLAQENAQLQLQIQQLQNQLEQQRETATDYLYADMQEKYIPARVVDLTTNSPRNHITLNKGSRDGIVAGSGVVCSEGVVGIVSAVNTNFCEVVPLIHTESCLSCRVRRTGDMGFTQWNGTNYRCVQLTDIARHADVVEGDTVVSSGIGGILREGIPVGVVEKVKLTESDSYYQVRMRLFTDYRRLRYVQVINNPAKAEMDSLRNESYN